MESIGSDDARTRYDSQFGLGGETRKPIWVYRVFASCHDW